MAARIRINYPSEESTRLLQQLREAVKPARLFRQKQDPIPFLAALTEAGEPGALRDLIGIMMDADEKWRPDCARAVSSIVAPLLPDRLPEWDEWVRRSWSVLANRDDPWEKIKPLMIEEFPLAQPANVIVLGLCASHRNGFLREAAVGHLGQSTNTSELGFLILRANDWVPGVQMRARTALMERLKSSYSSTLVRHLPLLDYLTRATRSDHRPLVTSIENFLRSEEGLPALLVNLDSEDYRVRRRCYELTYGAYSKCPEWLSEKVLADSDVVIRYRAYTQRLACDGPAMSTLRAAAQDSFARIRRSVFEICIQSEPTTRAELLREFLFDRSAQLRRDAQRQWSSLNLGDPAEVYRASLRNDSVSAKPPAVAGLGETGNTDDGEFIKTFVKHGLSGVRQMAIRSICRLQPVRFLEVVTEVLLNDSPGVAAAAETCLGKHSHGISAGLLWERAMNSGDVDRQIRVLRIFRQLSKWDRLECLLRAVISSGGVREFALNELDDWINRFNKTFTTLTDAQHSTLTILATQVKTLVPSTKVAQVEFVLRNG